MSWPDLSWLFALAVTVHNVEEAVWLPRWSRQGGPWRRPVEAFAFRFAVLVLTAFAYGVAYLASRGSAFGAYALAGYALAMLLNVFFPHLLATLALRQYAPGTATALFLNLPVCSCLLYAGFRDGAIDSVQFLWFGPACVLAIAAFIPLLFFLGSRISRRRISV